MPMTSFLFFRQLKKYSFSCSGASISIGRGTVVEGVVNNKQGTVEAENKV